LPDTAAQKSDLRDRAEATRLMVHGQSCSAAATHLCSRFFDAVGNWLTKSVVSLYWPMRTEIDVRPLMADLLAKGVQVALPVMDGKGSPLRFRAWSPGVELVATQFGFMEPPNFATELLPDIVTVPLLGFDLHGNRLGYGGGYYDRTLAHLRQRGGVIAVGVAYDEQECPVIPVHGGDERLDMVVTDRRIIQPAE
jgi:5-formyltetrahydrofolate cyclo-ligase